MMHNPIIVGATGGSGTRVLQKLIAAQNVYMGYPLNKENDALLTAEFLERHINPILSYTHNLNYDLAAIPGILRTQTLAALQETLKKLLVHKPTEQSRWGFKNPRSIFMLPFFAALYPDFIFVHMIRDGRDIALSSNKNQPLKHFHAAIPESLLAADSPEAAIRLWAKVNQEAAAWCAQHLKQRYIRIHHEALCANPEQEIKKLYNALGLPAKNLDEMCSFMESPRTSGRWRTLPAILQSELTAAAQAALTEFGYIK